MGSTRRSLLKKGMLGGGLLAASGLGLSLFPGKKLKLPDTPFKVLTSETYAILLAVVPHVLPLPEHFPSAREINVARRVDDLLALMHPADAAELNQALEVLENPLLGLMLDGRPQPFSTASVAVQEQTLRRWKNSSLEVRRTGYVAISGLVKSAYFSHPKTYKVTGYPGPPDFSNVPSPQPLGPINEAQQQGVQP